MKSVFYHSPKEADATAFYRGAIPISHLARQMPDVNFVNYRDVNWPRMAMHSALFLQRPSTNHEMMAVDIAKQVKVPIWIDHDDNLFELPKENPYYGHYQDVKMRDQIKKMIQAADLLTVATSELGYYLDQFREGKSKCIVIPNAIPNHIVNIKPPKEEPRKIISWRGTGTHNKDLYAFHDAIKRIHEHLPDFGWVFVGEPFWQTLDIFNGRATVVHGIDPLNCVDKLKSQLPMIHIVPLEDNLFNRTKSNIAWIESTLAGAVCVAPNWPEWIKPGIINYTNQDDLFGAVAMLAASGDYLKELRAKSMAYIQEHLTLDATNKTREHYLRQLMDFRP